MASEVFTRIKTAAVLIPAIILILVYASNTIVGVLILLLALIGSMELSDMLEQAKGLPLPANEMARSASLIPLFYLPASTVFMGIGAIFGGNSGLNMMMVLSIISILIYELIELPKSHISELSSLGIPLFGIVWIGWGFNYLTLIHNLNDGVLLLFFLLLTIWSSDSFAYFGGKRFGSTLLAPKISPKKTVEGSVCGVLASMLVGIIFSFFLPFFWITGIFLAAIVAILGQLGDLVESKIKRLCGVKDSGSLFPGHGGVLDRVDGLLVTAPVFFYLMQIILG